MRQIDIIVKDPDIIGGKPVFRGTRVPFQALLDYLEGGQTLDEFLGDFRPCRKKRQWQRLNLRNRLLSARWDEILLDECIPRKLLYELSDHDCQTVPEAGILAQRKTLR